MKEPQALLVEHKAAAAEPSSLDQAGGSSVSEPSTS